MDLSVLKQVMEELIPFNKFLGIQVESIEPGRALLSLPFREELIGDPVKRALHGGVLSTLADVAGGAAAWTSLPEPTARLSTVDLRVDYLRPGRLHTVYAEAITVRVGGRLAVTDMKMFHAGAESEPIATGKGVYVMKLSRHASKQGT
ncbi:MAG: hotdog fold thioesterase [Polyangiaceae bacterium]